VSSLTTSSPAEQRNDPYTPRKRRAAVTNYFSPTKAAKGDPADSLGSPSKTGAALGWDAPKETSLTEHFIRLGSKSPTKPVPAPRVSILEEAPPPPAQQQPLQSSEETPGPSPTLVVPTPEELRKRAVPDEVAAREERPIKMPRLEPASPVEALPSSTESMASSQYRLQAGLSSSYSSADAAPTTPTNRPGILSSQAELTTPRTKRYAFLPPRTRELLETLQRPQRQYRDPYFSDPADVPPRPREYGGRSFVLHDDSVRSLAEFEHGATDKIIRPLPSTGRVKRWEYATPPPSVSELKAGLGEKSQFRTSSGER
jgi:hypothetical protein